MPRECCARRRTLVFQIWLLDMFNPCYCLSKGLSEAASGALLLVPVTLEKVKSREIEL